MRRQKPKNIPIWRRLQERIGFSTPLDERVQVDENGLPIPDGALRLDVAGTNDLDWFLKGGRLGAQTIVSILEKQGIRFSSLNSVLDFGCGCGRVLRHLSHYEGVQLHGTDISSRSIFWCDANLNFAEFGTNRLSPSTRYRSSSFDFAYAFSVFTHLTQELQYSWMSELRRILKTGSHLLVTVHGNHYLDHIPDGQKEIYRRGEIVTTGNEKVGSNSCAAFHPEKYVRDILAPKSGFKVVDFIPEGALGNPKQDAYLLKADA